MREIHGETPKEILENALGEIPGGSSEKMPRDGVINLSQKPLNEGILGEFCRDLQKESPEKLRHTGKRYMRNSGMYSCRNAITTQVTI